MIRIPTSITIPLERKGLAWRFRDVAQGRHRTVRCQIVTRDTGQVILEETGPDELTALKRAAQSAEAVPKPKTEGEMRRETLEQSQRLEVQAAQIAELQAKLDAATAPKPEPDPEPKPSSGRGRKKDNNSAESADPA